MTKPDYDWWVHHAHEDSACLQLITDYDTFKGRVLIRAAKVGRTDLTTLVNHCSYRALFEQDRFGSMETILDDIRPLKAPSLGRALDSPIGLAGKCLADNQGAFYGLGLSVFWAPWAVRHDPGLLENTAAWAQSCGMNYIRWMGAHNWSGGTDPTIPGYFDLMHETIDRVASYGLRSQITLFTRRTMIDNPVEMVKEWAKVVNAHRDQVCLVEIANEWEHAHNGWSDEMIQDLGRCFRERSGAPLALSAPAQVTWEAMETRLKELYDGQSVPARTIHFPRRQDTAEGNWRWVRQPWHSRGMGGFIVDNEHQKWEKSLGGRQVDHAASACATALLTGCGMTAHHDNYGVLNTEGTYYDDARADQFERVFAAMHQFLPNDLPNWTATRVGGAWNGPPHPFPRLVEQDWTAGAPRGVSRSHAALDGSSDDFVMTLTGVRDHVTLYEPHAVPYTVLSLRDGQEVYTGRGPVTLHEDTASAYLVGTV